MCENCECVIDLYRIILLLDGGKVMVYYYYLFIIILTHHSYKITIYIYVRNYHAELRTCSISRTPLCCV